MKTTVIVCGALMLMALTALLPPALAGSSHPDSDFDPNKPYVSVQGCLSTNAESGPWGSKTTTDVEYIVAIVNPTNDTLSYTFNTTHVFDVTVTKKDGKEAWRYPKAGTVFEQQQFTVIVPPNGSTMLGSENWTNAPNGDFLVRAELQGYKLPCEGDHMTVDSGAGPGYAWSSGSSSPAYFGADGTTVAAGVAGGAVAAATVGVLTLTEVGKFAGMGLVAPLFTRLKRKKVLDNFTRGQLQGYVIANPGAHMNSIRDEFKLSNGEVAYHLRVLEREGYVSSMIDGLKRRFYPGDRLENDMNGQELSVTQNLLISHMERSPGIGQSELARLAGTSSQVVNYHMKKLWRMGLITLDKEGRVVKCTVHKEKLARFKNKEIAESTPAPQLATQDRV